MFCAFCGVAIHWLRTGSTVLPSRVEVTVKPVSLRPASADETATTPASSTSASKRLRWVIVASLSVARTAAMVRRRCCRDLEIALQKCFARRVEFLVLGRLEVRIDGQPVPLGGPKQRALLALLLL